jgi:hypothetical protein
VLFRSVVFTLQSSTLTLTANKDSVIRGNLFNVAIQGEALAVYYVYLAGANASDVNPTLPPGQIGMLNESPVINASYIPLANGVSVDASLYTALVSGPSSLDNTSAYFRTDASGRRTVQYITFETTTTKTYTIRVADIDNYDGTPPYIVDGSNDQVKVKVEKGAVTVTASGDRSYYIGEEIKFTGTNTDSINVYLFITGPYLLTDGEALRTLPVHQPAYNSSPIAVRTDNTWEYKWDTSNCGLDTGAYTIYATSKLTNGKSSVVFTKTDGTVAAKLSDSVYATVSVNLKQPFLSAIPSGTYVAKGDKVYIRGTAEGDPANLKIYVFGPNKFVIDTISVEDDGTYEYRLDIGQDWVSNQYYIVVEHPMYNNRIDVYPTEAVGNLSTIFSGDTYGMPGQIVLWIPADTQNPSSRSSQASFIVWGNGKLQGSNAADALTSMIDDANIDDLYTKLTITVQEPWIRINNPGDQAVGTTFAVSGTTNLAVDDQILVEIVSSSTTRSYSQSAKVVAGDGRDNTWSVDVDSTNFKPGEYTIKASGIEIGITTTKFNIFSGDQEITSPYNGSINLKSGWNFISVPKTLKTGNNTAASVFDGINMDNHSVLTYNAADASWTTLKGTDVVTPMTAYWVYSLEPETIPLIHPDSPSVPAVKQVYAGWNAIGLSADIPTRAGNALAGTTWRTLIPWQTGSQTWGTAIIHTATGENSPDRYMEYGNGYWLYVEENGILTGLNA